MNSFIQNLVSRHQQADQIVKPRSRSRFEPLQGYTESISVDGFTEQASTIEQEKTSPKPFDSEESLKLLRSKSILPPQKEEKVPAKNIQKTVQVRPEILKIESKEKERIISKIEPPVKLAKEKIPPILLNKSLDTSALEIRQQEKSTSADIASPSRNQMAIIQSKEIVQPDLKPIRPMESSSDLIATQEKLKSDPDFLSKPKWLENIEKEERSNANIPTIKVTIGKIEVKANSSVPKKKVNKQARKSTKPQLTLSDYLKKQAK